MGINGYDGPVLYDYCAGCKQEIEYNGAWWIKGTCGDRCKVTGMEHVPATVRVQKISTIPENWCNASFGPMIQQRGRTSHLTGEPTLNKPHHAYQCRLVKGHEGAHTCGAAQDEGYMDPPPVPPVIKPRCRSEAAKAVFG